MLFWLSVILFSMANIVVIHFLWLHCSIVVLTCFVFQSIVCTGMMKWYPDPQHIHCIQSCEVRVQTAKQSCIKYTSMCKYFPSRYQPHTKVFETVKWVSILVSTDTISGQGLEKYLLQLRIPELSFFPLLQIWCFYCGEKRKVQRSESQQNSFGCMGLLYHTFGGFHDTLLSFKLTAHKNHLL